MDRDSVGVGTEMEIEEVGRAGDDQIRSRVYRSERWSSGLMANKSMRSVVEGRGKGVR